MSKGLEAMRAQRSRPNVKPRDKSLLGQEEIVKTDIPPLTPTIKLTKGPRRKVQLSKELDDKIMGLIHQNHGLTLECILEALILEMNNEEKVIKIAQKQRQIRVEAGNIARAQTTLKKLSKN